MLLKTTPINLAGVSAVISENIIPVEKYCEGIASPKKLRKLIDTTGFESLSIADIDVCCSDMCFQAAEHLFDAGGFSKDEIGALIFITQSPDYRGPSTAYVLQKRLGLSVEIAAFDVNLGCSGFVYGLYLASSMLSGLGDKKILLCCGNVVFRKAKPTSTRRAVLAGDAGSCAIISRKDGAAPITFNIQSYGKYWEYLYSEESGYRYLKNLAAGKTEPREPDELAHMNGMAVMDFAVHMVVDNINELIADSGLDKKDIGAYLFHQPQKLIIDAMTYRLGLEPSAVIANAWHIGNTDAATIPLLLTEIGAAWSERPNKKVLMSGFGIGLSIASVIMDLDNVICLETKKYERCEL